MSLRNQRGYSRECLAELADISSKYLYEIETGKKGCSSYVLFRLAYSLDVSVDYLVSASIYSAERKILQSYHMLSLEKKEKINSAVQSLLAMVDEM